MTAYRFYLVICLILVGSRLYSSIPDTVHDPFALNLEQLMQIEVTSVTKKPQLLKDIPAAVYIISAEEIKNSGATNIPEALRLAPGVHVMALSHNRWAVAIRGAAREYSNKLQVLVDGRSVYSPTFSGVMWETLDVPLQNIERIEVIRGPGAAAWGSNAVNGVINIITSSAKETQGTTLSLASGDKYKNSVFIRHGFQHDDETSVRFYARAFEYDQSRQTNGQNGEDTWSNRSAGFRIDRERNSDDRFMLQGNVYHSRADDLLTMFSRPPAISVKQYTQKKTGYDMTARWDYRTTDGRLQSLQAAFESTQLHHIFVDENRKTFDLEFTERLNFKTRNEIVWGLGTRLSWDTIDQSKHMLVNDRKRLSKLFRLFINDDMALKKDKLRLHLAASLEHNNVTGFEFQPSLKFIATPDERNSIWLGWSRATRTPARIESGASYYAQAFPAAVPLPIVVDVRLNDTVSEKLDSFDLGWRQKMTEYFSFDLTGFYFKYKDAYGSHETRTLVDPAGYIVANRDLNNDTRADMRGLELALDWSPNENWKLKGTYSYININLALPANSTVADISKNVPERVFSVFSNLRLSRSLTWNLWYRHSGKNECGIYGPIPGFDVADTQLIWKTAKNHEVSLVAQNVFDKKHQEFLPEVLFSATREFGRKIYLSSEWNF